MKNPKNIYQRIKLSAIAALCLSAITCTSPGNSENSANNNNDTTVLAEKHETYPMPLIPAEITSQKESMQYALLNFWNRKRTVNSRLKIIH